MDEFPVLEVAQQAKARMEMREENEQRVFAAGIDPEEAADCSCECCPPRTSQEPNDYCCRSLFTFDTVRNGTKLRDGLVANMEEFGQHSCIIKDPLFRNYILTQNAARSAAETFAMMSGEKITDKNKSYRYGAYRLFVAPTMGHLGKGTRVRLPSCFVSAVRKLWPSPHYSGFSSSNITDMMPTCVSCRKFSPNKKDFHEFTSKNHLRPLWLNALTPDDTAKAELDFQLSTASGRQYVCVAHFSPDSFIEGSRVLKSNATPMSMRISPTYHDDTVPHSPPPTPVLPLLSTPVARPLSSRPHPSFRLASAVVPPCCRCCCKKETAADVEKDPNWTPPSPTIQNLPEAEYFLVSKASLLELLTGCNSCSSGKNSLSFTEDAHALTCTRKCTSCGNASKWSNSPVLETGNASSKEKLRKVNVDMVTGSTVTAVGTARLNNFLKAVGMNTVSKRTFHRHKNEYLLPAVENVFTHAQDEVFSRIQDRIRKGEKLRVAGDGSFDTRGYSAEWCRYFLVDADTGEALVHVLMNKKETGSSGKLEMPCLKKAIEILAGKIGGIQFIDTVVTDRHSAIFAMMKQDFPTITHNYDPWHYFRNLTMSFIKHTKTLYMTQVRETWSAIIVRKAYDAVVRAQGNGVLASEMFRSSLLCCAGLHDFSSDPSFTQFKKCLHGPPPLNFPYIQRDGRAFKNLEAHIFTAKNVEDIKHVCWNLKTSTVESLNSLAWRYAPKDYYFDRMGHELRTMMAMLHWNELRKDEAEGTRTITGKKGYFNHTLKKVVYRNVKTPAKNTWRDKVKKQCHEIRASLSSTPYSTEKKEKLEKQKQKDAWNLANTPSVPHPCDANLEESDDEDDLLPTPETSTQTLEEILEEARIIMEEDDECRRQWELRNEENE